MVRFSIRKKFWKALGLLYQMTVMIGNDGGNGRNNGGTTEMMAETMDWFLAKY